MTRAGVVVIGLGLGFVLGLGCKRGPDAPVQNEPTSAPSSASSSVSASASASASTSASNPHVVASALPVCGRSDDPLSAICVLGADASKARFECATPRPSRFCGAFDEWACRSASGEATPRVTFGASFDHVGATAKNDEMVDPKSYPRKGLVHAIQVSTAVKDDAEGNALVDSTRATFAKWGCVLRSGDVTARFDCGEWEAKVDYSDIVHRVRVDAAMKGFGECGGA